MAVKKIILKGEDLCIRKEAIAGEAISPGHFIEILAGAAALIAAVTAGLAHQHAYAIENEVVGGDIDTAYATDDTLLYVIPAKGAELNVLVDATVTQGELLEATVTGALSPITTGVAVAIALVARTGAGFVKVESL